MIVREDKHALSNRHIASRLLYEGAQIDLMDRQGRTPLMHAILKEHLEVSRVYVEDVRGWIQVITVYL